MKKAGRDFWQGPRYEQKELAVPAEMNSNQIVKEAIQMDFETTKATTPSPSARQEGGVTKMIENQTAKLPSTFFLALAGGAIALSLGFAATRERKGMANFVGQWVPTLLLLGIYNKIVKTHGSEKQESSSSHSIH